MNKAKVEKYANMKIYYFMYLKSYIAEKLIS